MRKQWAFTEPFYMVQVVKQSVFAGLEGEEKDFYGNGLGFSFV